MKLFRTVRVGSRLRPVTLAALGLLLVASLSQAQVVQQVPTGVRAIGMGGAYSSLAEDGSGLFWNPAGLAWIGSQEFSANHADLFGSGIRDNRVALVLPLSARQVVGMDWYRSGFDDGELGFGENRITAAWSMRPRPWWSVAVGAKYLTRSLDLDGSSVRRGSGWGFDLGAIATPMEAVRLGIVAQDISDTRLTYEDGSDAVAYPRTLRFGSSYAWRKLATVAFDLDDRWHVGLDLTPIPEVALRGGIQDDLKADEGATWSYGVGLKAGAFRIDYAFEQHPVLDGTHHMGVSVNFNLNPALVKIEKVEAQDVYASLYRSYAGRPIGTARIRNLEDRAIETQLSVFVPGLMDAPAQQSVVLRPKAVQDVPLQAPVSAKVMEQKADQTVQIQVGAAYTSRRLVRTEKASDRLVAYAPGAIDWSQGVAQAAAFVTPRDPVIETVARDAVRVVTADGAARFGTRNLAFAAALFDALGTFEIAYVPDPNNPFSSISETAHAVDTIQYPSQTLARRAGDCDDTTVLLAALLGSVGVNSRIVDAPGHVFLLVDAGLHERNRAALQVDDTKLVVKDEGVWVPIETTAIPKGFAEAWRVGAESYQSWAGRDQITLVDVAQAQSTYEPANPTGPAPTLSVDAPRLTERVGQDARTIDGWRGQRPGTSQVPDTSAAALNELAQMFYEGGQLDEARPRLEQALAAESQSAKLMNNMGLVVACQGDLRAGLDWVVKARQTNSADACIWINEGLVRLAAGDSAGARVALAEGVSRAGGVEEATRVLGVGSSGEPVDQEIQTMLRSILNEAARGKDQSGAPIRGSDLGSTRPRPDDLRRMLCWKE